MEEIKELRFGDSEIILQNNLVRSAILPTSTKELSRNLKVRSNSTIEGAVFGNKIDILDGNVTFKGAVYANDELHIAGDISQRVTFEKAVAAADTVSAFVTSASVIFGSDINAQRIRLKNCYVGGSLFAEEIHLEGCVVLGGVFATKQMTVTDSLFGTFHAPSAELSGLNYMLYPACFSVEPVSLLPNTEVYNLSLADLGALFRKDPERERTGKIRMDFENDHQQMVLVGEEDSTTVINSYSVSGRVLTADLIDFDKLQNHFLIEAGALGTQILKVYTLSKDDGTKSEPLTVENVAGFLFDVAKGRVTIQDLSGEIDFAELKKHFS